MTNFLNILLYNLYRLYWKEVVSLKKVNRKKKSTNVIAKFLHKILDCLKIILKIAQVLKAIFDVFHWNSKKTGITPWCLFFLDFIFVVSLNYNIIIYIIFYNCNSFSLIFLKIVRQNLTNIKLSHLEICNSYPALIV